MSASGTYTGTSISVVTITNTLTLSGGWNAGFSAQTGYSIIDGENTRQGIRLVSTLANGTLDYFIVRNGLSDDPFSSGGITNNGNLTLNNSLLMNNTTAGYGGGIYGGNITINNSAIFYNQVAFSGGGIHTQGNLTIKNSTISNNRSGEYGGGISVSGFVEINNATMTGNYAIMEGGGISGYGENIKIKNSIISDNLSGGIAPDCFHYGNGFLVSGAITLYGIHRVVQYRLPLVTSSM